MCTEKQVTKCFLVRYDNLTYKTRLHQSLYL